MKHFKSLLILLSLSFLLPFIVQAQTQTHTFSDGSTYVGDLKNGIFNGRGTLTFANGDKYVGEFKDGLYNGLGTLTFANGDKYDGEFKNGKCNGWGTYTFANRDKYDGEFKDGDFNGQGTMTYTNGGKYVGEFKDGDFNGWGTYTFANGDKYVGEFKDGDFNGLGTLTFANGNKYDGEFKNGKCNGWGTYTFANGNKYVGEFKDGKYIGQSSLNQTNLYEYVDLGLSVKWASCNVGANSPEQYGSHMTYLMAKQQNYRMPTKKQCDELRYYCECRIESLNGVDGVRFVSRINRKSIFIPNNGWGHIQSVTMNKVGKNFYLWTCSTPEGCPNYKYGFNFSEQYGLLDDNGTLIGVRLIKD